MNREEYQNSKIYFTKYNCPFCIGDVRKTHEIGVNLLVFPKRHLEFTSELLLEELSDFLEVEKFAKKFYEEKNLDYFSFVRQTKSNKSVEHLHYHYLPGKPSSRIIDGEKYLKIKN